jgi:ribosomal protein L37AE/L43A
MKPKEPGHTEIKPEPPEKRPEPPKEMKWECPTCKKAFPGRVTRSRFKCPHCRNWIYFLGDSPVTKEDHERLAEKYYETRYQERLRSEGRLRGGKIFEQNIKEGQEASKEELERYAEEEFVAGVEVLCLDDACAICKRIASKKYYFKDHVPLIPFSGCTSERGCLCCYTPFVDPL